MEQLDWIRLDDHRAQLALLLERAAERVGVDRLAHWLHEDPSTLRNQLARRERKRPSSDLEDLVWLLDPQYRHDKAAVTGELLTRPADLTPEQVANEIGVLAGAKGYASKEEVFSLLFRMRKAEQAAERLRSVP